MTAAFNPTQPRDRLGRWIEMGATVKWGGLGEQRTGKVTGVADNGSFQVTMKGGGTAEVPGDQLQVVNVKAVLPISQDYVDARGAEEIQAGDVIHAPDRNTKYGDHKRMVVQEVRPNAVGGSEVVAEAPDGAEHIIPVNPAQKLSVVNEGETPLTNPMTQDYVEPKAGNEIRPGDIIHSRDETAKYGDQKRMAVSEIAEREGGGWVITATDEDETPHTIQVNPAQMISVVDVDQTKAKQKQAV